MGEKFENKVVNKFDVDLKLIEEWIHKLLEKIDASLKATTGIKELNEMVNDDLECAYYRQKIEIPNDESEEKDIESSRDKE